VTLLRDLKANVDIDQSLLAAAMTFPQQPRHDMDKNQSHRAGMDGDR
jgi:hypothetical protein